MYTAYFLERLHRELPQVAANIQAISSVSGGSLASAAYVAFRREMLMDPGVQFWPRGTENTLRDHRSRTCARVLM